MKEIDIKGITGTIIEQLRINIVEGVLLPGQKLNELDIADRLGVSRPPLREAFRVLEGEDLVVNIPRKGCCVQEVSIEACQDIFQVREMMECYAIDIIREKKIKNFEKVESTLQQPIIKTPPATSNPYDKYRYLKAIADFHIQLVAAANNIRLNSYYQNIFPALARYQSLYTYKKGLMEVSKETHAEILELLKNRQYEKAKQKVRSHMRSFVTLIETQFKNGGLPPQ
jgi:DNA-binding GntR family transcriptional regulator